MAQNMNATDEQYLRLLELLSNYNSTLEQLQKGFRDGYIQLSRSNFYNKDSLRGNYGKDYWDKTYMGQLMATVEKTDSKLVVDIVRRKIQDKQEKKEEEDNKLTQRKKGPRSEEQKAQSHKPKQDYDPILMFGGVLSVPSSLRQSQTSFKGCIPLIAQLINYKNEISMLIKTLSEQE